MKTQSYYRCYNCGKIFTRDSGSLLSCCPDCGNGNLKVLVPVDDEMKGDPLSGRKKIALAGLIGLAGFASVTVFLLFGRLLQGYMTFDAGREAAGKAHERLAAEILVQEARLSSLKVKMAESESRESTLLIIEERFVALTNKISLAENERNKVLETLKTSNIELACVTGTVAGLNFEIGVLKRDKNGLMEAVDLERKKMDKAETEVQKESEMLRQTEVSATSAKAALAETQKTLQLERLALSNETVKIAGIRAKRADLEDDLDRFRKKVEARTAEDARLAAVIDDAVSRTNRLAFGVADAEKAKTSAVSELVKAQSALDAMNAARDKAREEADAQSARLALLAARKEAIDTDIRDMEKTKGTLDATILELKKQRAATIPELAKTQAALDTLNISRDKAREESDTQSARAAALKVEVSALEKAKAAIEKEKGVSKK